MATGLLQGIGVYGFEKVETVILAALVTEDPLLLIGSSGTGKTFLLNSISEAMSLEHRHYNASLISFDDLVGFPYPDDEKAAVRFLETPATVWGAESVLVDEISRCKPEHQNRLFSLVHERRIQGIALTRLRYRWAAMNPCSADQGGSYAGSEPLDHALADRFGLLVQVGDWADLNSSAKRSVADPSGEGAVSDDGGRLATLVKGWREEFEVARKLCPASIIEYACMAVTLLNGARIWVSPRRSRMLTRSLLAAWIVEGKGKASESVFRKVLECSLPNAAWGGTVKKEALRAAHRAAWDSSMLEGADAWVHRFHVEPSLEGKARLLLSSNESADTVGAAVAQMLASADPADAAAFAMALYPAAASGKLPMVGAEAAADLGRIGQKALSVWGEISWQERLSESGTQHPEFVKAEEVMSLLPDARKKRAEQLFSYLLVEKIIPKSYSGLEEDFEGCVRVVAEGIKSK